MEIFFSDQRLFFFIFLIINWIYCLQSPDGQCGKAVNGSYTFGKDCDIPCNCLNNEPCDFSIGACPECDFDWLGSACQYRNFAIGKNTKQSSNIKPPSYALLAVDRSTSTCSYTYNTSHNSWWKVWLPYTFNVWKITFVTSEIYKKNFKGFVVSVEYTPEDLKNEKTYFPNESVTCYKHNNSEPKTIKMNVECNTSLTGNQVRITLSQKPAKLVLCDVRIYGECGNGKYGENCTEQCSDNCLGNCDKMNGTCFFCKLGWTGPMCMDECRNGTFGENCSNQCSEHCLNYCDKMNGTCFPCKSGWSGMLCMEECRNGTYGENCSNICSENCLNQCDIVNGTCYSCKSGWRGLMCMEECVNGTYGENCANQCSENCLNNCDKINGSCSPCKAGWKGLMCMEECVNGTYGENCANQCSDNCLNHCDKINGSCSPCKAGWRGLMCMEECGNKTYGENCSNQCGKNCLNHCDKINGSCSHCKSGWRGLMCMEECENGDYGENCSKKCSDTCKGKCDKANGTCPSCKPGWGGSMCMEECGNGTYGNNCTMLCSENCLDECNKTSGTCLSCKPGWSGHMCLKVVASMTEGKSSQSHAGVVVGGTLTALVAIIIVIVTVILYKRRKHGLQYANKRLEEHNLRPTRCEQNQSDDTDVMKLRLRELNEANKTDIDQDDGYYNVGKVARMKTTAHSVFISQLKEYVTSCLADEEVFTKQFSEIPHGLLYSTNCAEKQSNAGKNRYKAMYAYDYSRVVLDTLPDEQDSDYINASFIQGHLKDNSYIASHGPIKKTVADFWRMVWEKKVYTIVMLTKLKEQTKIKCIQYWTKEGTSATIGVIVIVTETENVFADFTVRRLRISNTKKTGQDRVITQLHYTAWPDKDVPRTATSLLEFWHRVRRTDAIKSHPWLVHCSAGIGRTGTFIAIDKLYDQAIDQGFIDIFQCVKDLRDQRVNMVQTKDQYIFLHKIMLEILVLWSPPIKCENFIGEYAELAKDDVVRHKTKLQLQYETLNDTTTECQSGKVHVDLNGVERFDKRVVSMPSFTADSSFILASFGSKAIHYLQIIDKHAVNLIVSVPQNVEEETEIFLPDKDSVNEDPYTVSVISTNQDSVYTERCISFKQKIKQREIKQLIYNKRTSDCVDDPLDMLRFIQAIHLFRAEESLKRTLILSADGDFRSGLIVVLLNILERLKFDDEVSIPQVIRLLRSFNAKIIPRFDYFQFCYEVLKCYIDGNATYANI